MDSVSRYLVGPTVDCTRANNGKASGGLPHSEITGSKPIPGSPVLIAGYHVLHRLLLPRHPPNALLALDPIQRRTGLERRSLCAAPLPILAQTLRPARSSRKSYIFPPHARVRTWNIRLVYLTWNKTARGARIPAPPGHAHTRANQTVLMFLSLHNVTHRPDRTRQRSTQRSLIRSTRNNGQLWSLSGSNR